MAITNKIVYIKNKATFQSLISTIPANLDPIVFIEDSDEIWTCGHYFNAGYPSLAVSESGGQIQISLGDNDLSLITSGDSLSIKKGTSNSIILTSSALTSIKTGDPLLWADNTLIHKESGVLTGQYGPTGNSSNVNILSIPSFKVNDTGHIIEAYSRNLQIRDYVDQLAPTSTAVDRNILVSYNSANGYDDTQAVRKANGLIYNDSTKVLTVEGGITAGGSSTIKGDLYVTNGVIVGKVRGDVEGVAVPKVHLSETPEYGGASTIMYGHVVLQDSLPEVEPNTSSNNTDATNTEVNAIAATPLMVWKAMEKMKQDTNGIIVNAYDENNEKQELKTITFSNDFVSRDRNLYINWEEIK